MEHQAQMFNALVQTLNTPRGNSAASSAQQPCASGVPVPLPSPLGLEGDMAENFDFFEKSWLEYASAIGMDQWPASDNSKKVSFLLSVIGEPARKKFFNFELTPQQKVDPGAALQAIKAIVVPKRNVNVDRLDFFGAAQMPAESTDDFCSRLKMLARLAKLGTLATELTTFKLVTSNKWPHMRTKLLTMPDVTLDKAVDLCRAEEIASARAAELGVAVKQMEVNKIRKAKGDSKASSSRCKFCGDRHEFVKGVCPAFGKRCHRCHGKNHFEKVCKASAKFKSRKSKQVKEIREESDSEVPESDSDSEPSSQSDVEYEIGKVYDNSGSGGSVLAELDLKFAEQWESVLCELDTGANTSLIGHDYLVKLSGDNHPSLQSSKLRLQSFGGKPINVLGQVKVPCRRLDRKYRLVLQVVEGDHRPLLSAKASRELGFVKFCRAVSFVEPSAKSPDKLFNIYRIKAQEIIDEHQELFTGYGMLPGVVSLEVDTSIHPSIQPPRRVPIAVREKLKRELESLERDGIIVKETRHTDWVSNLVIVQRGGPESGVRICLDPVPLNKALKRPNLQFVTLDEILPELGKAKVFSSVDARKGFWHVVLDEPSSKLTTFWTPFGRYRWTRLPFGIAPAPEIFQIKLQEVIQGLKGVECIADDLLIFGVGDTLEEALANHNECLERLLIRLEQHNVKLNRSKLKLCERSVKFYGHVLTDEGLKPDEDKVIAIRDYPTPINRKEVHRFIGMVNYLSRFIRNLSTNMDNLRRLISEFVTWQWTSVEQAEFDKVKSLVADINTLRYYDVTHPVVIECDASSTGLGVAIFQREGVIGYASRTLTPTERNYAQIEKELLAILFACVRFDQLIVGNPKATIRTDHKPLIAIFKKPLLSAPRRLQHMLLNLQRYNLSVEFVTGKDNVVADALSRACLPAVESEEYKKQNIYKVLEEVEEVKLGAFLRISDSKTSEIIEQTEKDPSMQLLMNYIQHGWPESADRIPDSAKIYFNYRHELSCQDGLIFRNDRILVPHVLRRSLVESCHASHNGVEATLKLARANLFWPGMNTQIKDVVKQCVTCAKFAPSQANPPMRSHEIPIYPFQLASMDVFFAEYRGTKRSFLITVDHYSDFFELDILKDLTPESVIIACKENFARHGIPQRVVCDNGTNFANQKMMKFASEWDFELVTSAPYHQQANGKAEAAVKVAKHLLKKANESGSDYWYALLHWRNIPNKIGSSPVARLFSRSTRCGVPAAVDRLRPVVVENVPTAIEANRKRAKFYYDKKAKQLPELQVGSPVHVQLRPDTSKLWAPGTVSSCLNDRSFVVNVDGVDYRRSLVHLKPRKVPETQPVRSAPAAPTRNEIIESSPAAVVPNGISSTCVPVDCQERNTNNNNTNESTPTLFTQAAVTPVTPSTENSNRSRPVTPAHTGRPKRNIRVPAKLNDYQLDF